MCVIWLIILVIHTIAVGPANVDPLFWLLLIVFMYQDRYDIGANKPAAR